MANILQIKRSNLSPVPVSLREGELAYSEVSGNLFIGTTYGALEIIGGKSVLIELANKANISHTHTKFDISDLVFATSSDIVNQTAGAIVTADILPTSTSSPASSQHSIIRDVRPLGEHGGTSRKKKWNVRVLNEITFDPHNNVTLSGDDFLLVAGTYKITVKCPADHVDQHKVRLVNETTDTCEFEGVSLKTEEGIGIAEAVGIVVSDGTGIYEVQHYTKKKKEEEGLGEAMNIGDSEVYTVVEIERIS